MQKPTPLGNITIEMPDSWTKEQQQKYVQETVRKLNEEHARKERDWEMYQQGRRDSQGILGIFGL